MVDLNTATITFSSTYYSLTEIAYVPNSFFITPGQEGGPSPTIQQTGTIEDQSDWTITVPANHSNSTIVAQNFIAASGGPPPTGQSNMFSPADVTTYSPDQLNFCFGLIFTIKGGGQTYQVPLNFGQGHMGFPLFRNNWWIGGAAIVYTEYVYNPSVILTIPGGAAQFNVGGGVSSFTFSGPVNQPGRALG
jgi:hypothetical protein